MKKLLIILAFCQVALFIWQLSKPTVDYQPLLNAVEAEIDDKAAPTLAMSPVNVNDLIFANGIWLKSKPLFDDAYLAATTQKHLSIRSQADAATLARKNRVLIDKLQAKLNH